MRASLPDMPLHRGQDQTARDKATCYNKTILLVNLNGLISEYRQKSFKKNEPTIFFYQCNIQIYKFIYNAIDNLMCKTMENYWIYTVDCQQKCQHLECVYTSGLQLK